MAGRTEGKLHTMNARLRISRSASGIVPEAATGWLRFGVMAVPQTAPPAMFLPS